MHPATAKKQCRGQSAQLVLQHERSSSDRSGMLEDFADESPPCLKKQLVYTQVIVSNVSREVSIFATIGQYESALPRSRYNKAS